MKDVGRARDCRQFLCVRRRHEESEREKTINNNKNMHIKYYKESNQWMNQSMDIENSGGGEDGEQTSFLSTRRQRKTIIDDTTVGAKIDGWAVDYAHGCTSPMKNVSGRICPRSFFPHPPFSKTVTFSINHDHATLEGPLLIPVQYLVGSSARIGKIGGCSLDTRLLIIHGSPYSVRTAGFQLVNRNETWRNFSRAST